MWYYKIGMGTGYGGTRFSFRALTLVAETG